MCLGFCLLQQLTVIVRPDPEQALHSLGLLDLDDLLLHLQINPWKDQTYFPLHVILSISPLTVLMTTTLSPAWRQTGGELGPVGMVRSLGTWTSLRLTPCLVNA